MRKDSVSEKGGRPAKRGEVAVVQQFHQSTAMHGRSNSYATFRVGEVTKVHRDGTVAAVTFADQTYVTTRNIYKVWIASGVPRDAAFDAIGSELDAGRFDSINDVVSLLEPLREEK